MHARTRGSGVSISCPGPASFIEHRLALLLVFGQTTIFNRMRLHSSLGAAPVRRRCVLGLCDAGVFGDDCVMGRRFVTMIEVEVGVR